LQRVIFFLLDPPLADRFCSNSPLRFVFCLNQRWCLSLRSPPPQQESFSHVPLGGCFARPPSFARAAASSLVPFGSGDSLFQECNPPLFSIEKKPPHYPLRSLSLRPICLSFLCVNIHLVALGFPLIGNLLVPSSFPQYNCSTTHSLPSSGLRYSKSLIGWCFNSPICFWLTPPNSRSYLPSAPPPSFFLGPLPSVFSTR